MRKILALLLLCSATAFAGRLDLAIVQFPEVKTIEELKKLDDHNVFAEPVTTDVASNYFDIIRNPMDLATMTSKANR